MSSHINAIASIAAASSVTGYLAGWVAKKAINAAAEAVGINGIVVEVAKVAVGAGTTAATTYVVFNTAMKHALKD